MSTGENTASPAPAAETATEKKHWWDRVLTITPIIMTVLATFLAGKSSGEMTKAMYHRSIAAQEESKGSNQWSYFQAKRIRGQGLEVARDELLLGSGGIVNKTTLEGYSKRFQEDLQEMQKDTDSLVALLEGGPPMSRAEVGAPESGPIRSAPSPAGKPLARCKALQETLPKMSRKAEDGKALPESELAKVADAGNYFGTDELPQVEEEGKQSVADALKPALDGINPALWQAIDAIRDRKTEKEINEILLQFKPDDLQRALRLAEGRNALFEKATSVFPAAYRKTVAAAAARERLAAAILTEVKGVKRVLPSALSPEINDLTIDLTDRAESLHQSALEALRAAQATRLDFDARRYRREGDYNQYLGYLREMQARRSALESDRHHFKSEMYFYAMLAAQVGVTVATFAMAVRFKSAMWGLASLAAVAAMGVAGYVGYTQGF